MGAGKHDCCTQCGARSMQSVCHVFFPSLVTTVSLFNVEILPYFPDMIRDVHDPEKPETLEELNVVCEEGVKVTRLPAGQTLVTIQFVPTVPHCSLASIIGEFMNSQHY